MSQKLLVNEVKWFEVFSKFNHDFIKFFEVDINILIIYITFKMIYQRIKTKKVEKLELTFL